MKWCAPAVAVAAFAALGVALACCQGPQVTPDGKPARPAAPAQRAPATKAATSGIALELFFTGSDDGYLDACGCDDGQTGGLPRRHTLMRYLGLDDGHALLLSAGGLVAGKSPLDVDKFETIVQAMQLMGYGGIALTERELALGRAELVAMAAAFFGDECPLLATNLVDTRPEGDASFPALPTRRSVVRTLRGQKIAVLASIAESRAPLFAKADAHVRVDPPLPAVKAELAAIAARDGKPARTVVLTQASEAEARALARDVPGIDLIVLRKLDDDDFSEQLAREGTTDLVTTGQKGKSIGRYRFAFGADMGEFKSEAVVDGLEKSQSIRDLVGTYRDLLKDERLIERYFAVAPDRNGATYAGADAATCVQCHEKSWKIWKESRHARAWKTLEDQDLPEKPGDTKGHLKNAIWDPDCVRCHTTGFGEKTGYRGHDHEKAEAPLVNVTCEACHGPSGDHAERAARGDPGYPGGTIARVKGGAAWSLCYRCHDPDNSTSFDLAKYWVGYSHGEQREPVEHGKD